MRKPVIRNFRHKSPGFTLIELSIVLVIIGLLVGGIVVGQIMIDNAASRSQITQIEQFKTATTTFRLKFNYLPGDIPSANAVAVGLLARSSAFGCGNGDGKIYGCGDDVGNRQSYGETPMFWRDLSDAKLIAESFVTATPTTNPSSDITGDSIALYFPKARLSGNYVYIWPHFPWSGWINQPNQGHYFTVSGVSNIAAASVMGRVLGVPAMKVANAFSIDSKIDDGLPQSGMVVAAYVASDPVWADYTNILYNAPNTNGTGPSATSCFDNGWVAGTHRYSMSYDSGASRSCVLSFYADF